MAPNQKLQLQRVSQCQVRHNARRLQALDYERDNSWQEAQAASSAVAFGTLFMGKVEVRSEWSFHSISNVFHFSFNVSFEEMKNHKLKFE